MTSFTKLYLKLKRYDRNDIGRIIKVNISNFKILLKD